MPPLDFSYIIVTMNIKVKHYFIIPHVSNTGYFICSTNSGWKPVKFTSNPITSSLVIEGTSK